MRLVLLHYHILKNAGSTVEDFLRRSFVEDFMMLDQADRDAEIKQADLVAFLERYPRVKALSSHQIFYPVPKAPGFLFFDICFLRDPIDRIRSIYDYFRAKSLDGDPIRQLAHRLTLGEFTRHLIEEMPWTLNDVQVNLLAHGRINDQPGGIADLDVATRTMLETSFLGVVDRFDESLVAGQYGLSQLFPALNCKREPVNNSARPGSTLADRLEQFRESCDEDVYAELLRLNAMDFELLRRARAEVRHRFEPVPDREERLDGLKQRVATSQSGLRTESACEQVRQPRKFPPIGSPPGMFTKLRRGLGFVANFRAARPGSQFRRLFDAKYYRESYPEVAASGANPLWHFVTRGAFEGRNPNPLFDTAFYLRQCPRPPSTNAVCDYLAHGASQGRRPHPLFDSEYYLRRYPGVWKARMNPLLHYILHGAAECLKPNLLFQPNHYLTLCPGVQKGGNPLIHFVASQGKISPHPLFDCESYLRAHPEIKINPLVDFLTRPKYEPRACERDVGTFEAARFTIDEVDIMVVFCDSGFDTHAEQEQREIHSALQAHGTRDGFSGELTVAWRDECGRKKFLCAPQQRRFFECTPYDQLDAQSKTVVHAGPIPLPEKDRKR